MTKLQNLNDLFIEELQELYDAENRLVQALPAMIEAAYNVDLKSAFSEHRSQASAHVARLETIFESLQEPARGKTSKAMKGLVADATDHRKEKSAVAVKDASLIASVQRMAHYEIAGYGTARTFAETLGYREAAELLQRTLNEEAAADDRLSHIAQGLNVEAMVAADSFTARLHRSSHPFVLAPQNE